ncbi:MAG: hypothetical protein HUJ73_01285 [Eubacterium sp.]|nr:hypothetical protein [Eubacterium sp.]
MIALPITHIKDFMNKLLLTDTFDRFLVSEASITTFTTFHIDGQLHREFFDEEKAEDPQVTCRSLVSWGEIRNFCLSVIKGKRSPISFKLIFQLPAAEMDLLLARAGTSMQQEDIFGVFFNCQFHNDTLTITTGTSLRVFTMDRSLDHAWDEMLSEFLRSQELE